MRNSVGMIHSGYLMNLTNLVGCEVPYLLVCFPPFNLRWEKAIEGVKKIGPTHLSNCIIKSPSLTKHQNIITFYQIRSFQHFL